MRAPMKAAVLFAVMVLASFSVANGQAVFVNVDEVQGLNAEGLIPAAGTNLVIPVRFTNAGAARTAISNGYDFKGDVTFTGLTGAWNPAYPWNWELAFPAGCYPPACYPYFDQGTFINYFTGGVGFAGLTGASGTGLPIAFDGIAYRITLNGVAGDGGAVLTMDSTWWLPANYWLWSGVASNVAWGGPYEFVVEGGQPPCPEPYTTCWPQPSVLKALENDRILEFYVYCQDPAVVDMASMEVNGIPNYLNDGVAVYDAANERIWTNAFIMRFLGASGFRPIPSEGITSTYTLTYMADGAEVALIGDFVLTVYQGDVNFDTIVDIQDVIFLTNYLFDNGRTAQLHGEDVSELMDVDASGRFDLLDIQAAIQISGI